MFGISWWEYFVRDLDELSANSNAIAIIFYVFLYAFRHFASVKCIKSAITLRVLGCGPGPDDVHTKYFMIFIIDSWILITHHSYRSNAE